MLLLLLFFRETGNRLWMDTINTRLEWECSLGVFLRIQKNGSIFFGSQENYPPRFLWVILMAFAVLPFGSEECGKEVYPLSRLLSLFGFWSCLC